jgi:DNA recombination protein RmuC
MNRRLFQSNMTQLKIKNEELTQLNKILTEKSFSESHQIRELETLLKGEREQTQEKLNLMQNAKEELSNQFKILAQDILEEKSKKFTEQNQNNLEQLLNPLKVNIQEFKVSVHDIYVKEGKDRTALSEQVKQLMQLNQQLSKDAHNLTRALKGDSKFQGNWGEFILEKVLDNSGLTKGIHYKTQDNHLREDGSRSQPDVVLYLPENKNLIIDAKVSLVAYEEYVNAESDMVREIALKKHLTSIRSHIKGLSCKNYHDIYQLKSIDFVLMFIPIEAAFLLPISQDSELWLEAWKQNVLLVSPSTLLFVVRTVAHLWRQEQQTKNAQDIAKRGAELYDKLVGFMEDFEKIGRTLNMAKDSFDNAWGKFSRGRGNLIRQAEMLRELGIKPNKSVNHSLIEAALEE